MLVVVLLILLWVVCSGVAAVIAQGRGLPVGKFALAGLVLGIIGVLWAAIAPKPRAAGEKPIRARDVPLGKSLHDLEDQAGR